MDNSHVALVSMLLRSEAFAPFRCDRNIALGINLGSLTKVLRAAQNEDMLTIKAEDAPDVVNLVFENKTSDRISEFDIKLMDIDQEHLGIPETDYAATITMPAPEFQRICRDLSALSESGMHEGLGANGHSTRANQTQSPSSAPRMVSSLAVRVTLARARCSSGRTAAWTSRVRPWRLI